MYDYLREMFSYPSLFIKLAKVKKTIVPKKINFGPDKNQYFLHFSPQTCDEAHNKIIVWVHGGGWNTGTPKTFEYVGQFFAKAGYHCISLGYRLSPRHKYPAQIEDVCGGFKKGIEYLETQNINCDKILVSGPSAGAHLASLLCYSQEDHSKYGVDTTNVIGFIGVAGPYYFRTKLSNTVNILLNQLFAGKDQRIVGEPYALLAKNHIPMLLIHSKHDGLIDYSMSEKFHEKAQTLGIECELHEVIDKINTHSAYSAGMFLETRETNKALNKLFAWIESR